MTTAQHVKRIRKQKNQVLREYKSEHGCADCGERDWVVLELDHRDGELKNPALNYHGKHSGKSWTALSWKALYEELPKCDVVCCNCHRRRTFERAGNWNDEGEYFVDRVMEPTPVYPLAI